MGGVGFFGHGFLQREGELLLMIRLSEGFLSVLVVGNQQIELTRRAISGALCNWIRFCNRILALIKSKAELPIVEGQGRAERSENLLRQSQIELGVLHGNVFELDTNFCRIFESGCAGGRLVDSRVRFQTTLIFGQRYINFHKISRTIVIHAVSNILGTPVLLSNGIPVRSRSRVFFSIERNHTCLSC